jgi:ribosomal protein S21
MTGSEKETSKTAPTTETESKETQKQEGYYSKAEVDSLISKAIKTREENLKNDFEKNKLLEERKYKELYEKAEEERKRFSLERETVAKLTESKDLDYLPLVVGFGDSIEAKVEMKDKIKQLVQSQVEKLVAERLKTDKPASSTVKTGPVDVSKMTTEEYKAYRKTIGIQ